MASALFRLLATIAVLLMPAGMASAPAMAQSAPAAAGHCDEHREPADSPPSTLQAHCAGCAALPAFAGPVSTPSLLPAVPGVDARIQRMSGTEPEIATRPPKLS